MATNQLIHSIQQIPIGTSFAPHKNLKVHCADQQAPQQRHFFCGALEYFWTTSPDSLRVWKKYTTTSSFVDMTKKSF
jgi:hypothetical protein